MSLKLAGFFTDWMAVKRGKLGVGLLDDSIYLNTLVGLVCF